MTEAAGTIGFILGIIVNLMFGTTYAIGFYAFAIIAAISIIQMKTTIQIEQNNQILDALDTLIALQKTQARKNGCTAEEIGEHWTASLTK